MINGAAPCMPGSGAAGGGGAPPDPPSLSRSPPGRQQVPGTARSAAPAAGVQGKGSSRLGPFSWDTPVWGGGVMVG